MQENLSIETSAHAHAHARNRFAVIPVCERLDASADYAGRGVTIAFLDSGFYPHPDLTEPRDRVIAFQDIAGEISSLDADAPVQSWQWHGTQTSVVAAGNGRLSDGLYRGLASEARLVLVKVSERGRITEENIARGIRWVIEHRERFQIRVLNISLGGDEDIPCSQSIVDLAAEEAVRAGIVVVAAAGNSGDALLHTSVPPANAPNVITVGGYDDRNQLEDRRFDLYHSNFGATADGFVKPELIAPAMWVAAPILPGTMLYRTAEQLSELAHAPDYRLRGLARNLDAWGSVPSSLFGDDAGEIRLALDSLLMQNKIIATHYQHVDGTSFAAPVVSSVVAQMLEANPTLTPAAVKNILVTTAARLGGAEAIRQGHGVLNARRAVELAGRERHKLDRHEAPRVRNGQLVFFYHDDEAEHVALAGDFNGWNPRCAPLMREADGIWRAEIAPPAAGRYRYKFVVNEDRWTEDPLNGLKEPDEYGGFNSLLEIN
ncbi:MAG TPA: S8 family serine peptidase [Pyrinomonadaceae bacterium]|nr:S8 family serine peptidase [Pyrinomonadaceae bacterium]